MLLKGRNAVVYGAGGALGGAVSRAFAREGAAVFLTGRLLAPVDEVATRILVAGGTAEAAVVDANAEQAVEEHAQTVVDRAGSLDISINLIAVDHIQGRPLIDLSPSDFTLGLEDTYTLRDGPGRGTAHGAAAVGRDPHGYGNLLHIEQGDHLRNRFVVLRACLKQRRDRAHGTGGLRLGALRRELGW